MRNKSSASPAACLASRYCCIMGVSVMAAHCSTALVARRSGYRKLWRKKLRTARNACPTRSARRLAAVAEKRPQLVEEIAGVLELPIDAREPDEGYFVEVAKMVHDDLAQSSAFDFIVKGCVNV